MNERCSTFPRIPQGPHHRPWIGESQEVDGVQVVMRQQDFIARREDMVAVEPDVADDEEGMDDRGITKNSHDLRFDGNLCWFTGADDHGKS